MTKTAQPRFAPVANTGAAFGIPSASAAAFLVRPLTAA